MRWRLRKSSRWLSPTKTIALMYSKPWALWMEVAKAGAYSGRRGTLSIIDPAQFDRPVGDGVETTPALPHEPTRTHLPWMGKAVGYSVRGKDFKGKNSQ